MAVRGLRWWIIGLVFLATVINFIDRLTIAILAPVITVALGLTNQQFASLTIWFLAAYTASQGPPGSTTASAPDGDSRFRCSCGRWPRRRTRSRVGSVA